MSKQRKTYSVPTKFIFSGVFYIKADTPAQAREFVEKHCGLVIGGDIHSTLPDDMVEWNFIVHPEKVIGGAYE